jgi:hypothetical protein
MNENTLQAQIMRAIGSRSDCRVFRNHVRTLKDDRGQWHQFGLFPGSADIVGIQTVEHAGRTFGIWFSIEVKAPGARTDPKRLAAQKNWRDFILSRGGKAGFASSVEEAERILE